MDAAWEAAIMPFYGDMTPVESFIYRKMLAEIFRAVKGGRCEKCDLDLEHDERVCAGCGDEIFPTQVYPIKVSGNLIGWDGDTIEEAKELARAWIDHLLNDPDEEPEPDIDFEVEDPPPKKGGKKGRKRQEAGKSPGAGAKPSLVKQVRRLGWGKRALAILRN